MRLLPSSSGLPGAAFHKLKAFGLGPCVQETLPGSRSIAGLCAALAVPPVETYSTLLPCS